ncbi:MAG: TldD/PmbA family protein [Candidatus Bathyarchaeota archaeon]
MEQLSPEELINYGKKAINTAMRKGADEADVFLTKSLKTSVAIERGQITKNMRKKGQGLAVRAIYQKGVGFSYTNILNEDSIIKTATEAYKSAKASRPDKEWPGFPNPKKYGLTKETYDNKLAAISSEELVSIASRMLEEASSHDKRILAAFGSVETEVASKAIINSHGVEAFDKGTGIGCVLGTVARQSNEVTPICVEFNIERLYRINPEWIGKEAAKQAISSLKARKVDSGNYTVVFGQLALYGLLYHTFINSVKADQVQRGQSSLKGKIGEKVASDLISIQDDGLMANGLQTWKFDDEGIPQQKTPIVQNGILKNYLYDCHTAKKENTESTGNALRRGQVSYVATPVIEATNFVLEMGKTSNENIVEDIKSGVLVHGLQGAHSSNPATGEFSVVATPAWMIKNGEISHATKGSMLAGSIFDVLKNVASLGNNQRKIEQIVAPWISTDNLKVIGK